MPASPTPDFPDLDADTRQVGRAMALLWTFRSRAAIHELLQLLGSRTAAGQAFTLDDVNRALDRLRERDQVIESPEREGCVRLADTLRGPLYAAMLAEGRLSELQHALHQLEGYQPETHAVRWPLNDQASTIAILRLSMFSGQPAAHLHDMAGRIAESMDWDAILAEAAFAAFDSRLLDFAAPDWAFELVAQAGAALCRDWQSEYLPVVEWGLAQAEVQGEDLPAQLRLVLAEVLTLRGDARPAEAMAAGTDDAMSEALHASRLVQAGHPADAQGMFEVAIRRRQGEIAARKHVLPVSIAWLYPLSLLSQRNPALLEEARKFCVVEAGTRTPEPGDPWGRWVHAIAVRLGETSLDPQPFLAPLPSGRRPGWEHFWQVLLAAWIGPDALGSQADDQTWLPRQEEIIEAVRKPLRDCRFPWLEAQLDAAAAILHGQSPNRQVHFFAAGRGEAWRDVLSALQALGEESLEEETAGEASRLVWSIRMAADGSLEDIEVLEQKRGLRGWSKPRPLSLAKVAVNEKLAPHDAMVARAIRPDRNHAGRYILDRAAAIMALVGHPAVVLADAPEQFVQLTEAQPEVEVIKEDGEFVIRVNPPLRPETQAPADAEASADELRELDALRGITLVRNSRQRIHVVRLSPPQRRAAQLLGERFAVPSSARDELQASLRSLAAHFQVQADQAQAAREVRSDSRLRAELSPVGEHLLLRLVVAPLGPEGPRLTPGQGRLRLMATQGGEPVVTRRSLDAERAHLEAVLDAFNFLDDPGETSASYEWLIEDPENALAVIERLPTLPGVAAIDWPKGKPLRVVTVDIPHLKLNVTGEQDWFKLDGQAALDEGIILRLGKLLEAARGKSRFVPMGEGVYAALSRQLKQRLVELGILSESNEEGNRIPRLASAWLDEVLDGVEAYTDADFQAAVARLRSAQDQVIKLPRTLQAELRPYQEDGFRWAMRLAAAGFGACLADDMGLGKTLQTLALLLARAKGGPALVLVPTSLAGNWQAEADQFAPSLNVRLFGEGDRTETLAGLGAGDVLIASYNLFLIAHEQFAEIHWHTIVADEAQAIKNAAAKRSMAVFELNADFRLALSGTPVENRLSELWSIMRFVNPGLLGSLSSFNERFANPIEREHDRQAQHLLRRLVAPFILRRTKAQVLQELPPRTELIMSVSPDPEEAAHYEALRRQAMDEANRSLADQAPGEARINILGQLTRLRRAACDPRLVTADIATPGAKVQAFAELAEDLSANGHKALVFSQFVDFLELLRAPLDAAGIPYQYIDGSVPAADRTERVAAFQAGEGDLFLISLKAGGFGLNLTAADYVVITDPWWNPAAEDQAMGRAHRMGQKRPVTVYRMVTRGTVEERIVSMHRDKRALAESILAEGDATSLPSGEDLISLIRLSMG